MLKSPPQKKVSEKWGDICYTLCLKYSCYNFSQFYSKVPFFEIETIFKLSNYQQVISLACEKYSKKMFDLQTENRFYYLINCIPFPLNYTDCSYFFEDLLNSNGIIIKNFVKDFKQWLQMKDLKKNIFWIYGVPSSGKTLISKLLQQAFICSTITSKEAENDFCLGNCLKSSIILCEEPFYNKFMLETMKQIGDGSTVSVNVKYLSTQTLPRTPIFITSNHNSLSRGYGNTIDENAIKTRSYVYVFSKVIDINYTVTVYDFIKFLNKYNES